MTFKSSKGTPSARSRDTLVKTNYCLIFKLIKMKKILFLSVFMLAVTTFTSCTADSISDNVPHQTQADDTGGQSGLLTPPPPPRP
jgi:hypothetical protein